MKGLKAAIEFIFVYLVIRRGALFLAWNPVAWLCCLPLRSALSAKAIHQRIDTFIRRPNTSRPEYLRCCRSLHFSRPYAWLTGGFDQTFIFGPASTLSNNIHFPDNSLNQSACGDLVGYTFALGKACKTQTTE